MFNDESKFHVQFLRKVTQTTFLLNYFKTDQLFLRRGFLRISSSPHSARSPHSPEPCLLTDQNSANNL